jgi:hypothetical protein
MNKLPVYPDRDLQSLCQWKTPTTAPAQPYAIAGLCLFRLRVAAFGGKS